MSRGGQQGGDLSSSSSSSNESSLLAASALSPPSTTSPTSSFSNPRLPPSRSLTQTQSNNTFSLPRPKKLLTILSLPLLFFTIFYNSVWSSHIQLSHHLSKKDISGNGSEEGRWRKDDAYYDTKGTWGDILNELDQVEQLRHKKKGVFQRKKKEDEGTAVTGLRGELTARRKHVHEEEHKEEEGNKVEGGGGGIDAAAIFEKLRAEYDVVQKHEEVGDGDNNVWRTRHNVTNDGNYVIGVNVTANTTMTSKDQMSDGGENIEKQSGQDNSNDNDVNEDEDEIDSPDEPVEKSEMNATATTEEEGENVESADEEEKDNHNKTKDTTQQQEESENEAIVNHKNNTITTNTIDDEQSNQKVRKKTRKRKRIKSITNEIDQDEKEERNR